MLETCQTKHILTRREFDSETSLYYYRARYYHPPAASLFLLSDPFVCEVAAAAAIFRNDLAVPTELVLVGG